MMPGWHPVVLITLLSSGMLSNSQVRALKMCQYLCFVTNSFLLGCISLTLQISRWEWVVCLLRWNTCSLAGQSSFQVWMAMSRGFHTAADSSCILVVLLLLHESHDCVCFIYTPFILSWLPILIREFLDFEANCAPTQPLLPQSDKQECDWK